MNEKKPYTPSEDQVRLHYSMNRYEGAQDRSAADFDRFIAKVKRDAARDALDGLAAESRELARDMEPHDQGANAYTARAARLYRDTHYPRT